MFLARRRDAGISVDTSRSGNAASGNEVRRYVTGCVADTTRWRACDERPVKGGSPLLFSLMEEEIYIPSACGGKGSCALCKVKVLEGGGPILPTETPYLSPDEVKRNVRLSCQVKVKNDLKIEIPEALFLIKEFEARVDRIEVLTDEINGLNLTVLK